MVNVLFLGFGYSARWLRSAMPKNYSYYATCNISKKTIQEVVADVVLFLDWGVVPVSFDREGKLVRLYLAEHDDGRNSVKTKKIEIKVVDFALVSAPPDKEGDVFIDFVGAYSTFKIKLVCYMSSLSVYGYGSSFIDENSECKPARKKGVYRLRAEKQWIELCSSIGCSLFILRLPSIYGPGRIRVKSYRKREEFMIYKKGHFFNRIYIKDLVNIVKSVYRKFLKYQSKGVTIYNVRDYKPCANWIVHEYYCYLLNVRPVDRIDISRCEAEEDKLLWYDGVRFIDISRICKDLSLSLNYPTYRQGVLDIVSVG